MKRMGWTLTTLVLGLGLGIGGFAIQPYVAGQESQKTRDLKMAATSESISGRVKTVCTVPQTGRNSNQLLEQLKFLSGVNSCL